MNKDIIKSGGFEIEGHKFIDWRWWVIKKYNDIWNKASNSIKKEFDGARIYNKKFLKTKRKSYSDEATDVHDKEISKVGSNQICLAVIFINFVLKRD